MPALYSTISESCGIHTAPRAPGPSRACDHWMSWQSFVCPPMSATYSSVRHFHRYAGPISLVPLSPASSIVSGSRSLRPQKWSRVARASSGARCSRIVGEMVTSRP